MPEESVEKLRQWYDRAMACYLRAKNAEERSRARHAVNAIDERMRVEIRRRVGVAR